MSNSSRILNRARLALVGKVEVSQPLIEVVAGVSSSVGVIIVDKGDSALDMNGTGFCVDERGLFLTAYHYLGGFRRATLILDREYSAEPVAVDEEKDLALFSINPTSPLIPLRFAACLPSPAANLVGVGHVNRHTGLTLAAYAACYLDRLESVTNAQAKAEIDPERLECSLVLAGLGLNIPGFSGGPILNQSGEVEAITSGGDGESLVTAVSAAAGRELTDWYRARIGASKTA